ncbi:MAG TPA: hypothetical protein RMH99_24395 [Sandaracinaceae bacterium LLY-WYZ-13_1]|nr:hypothetical protein [Sandaracinaceae bacterium LLY-WYZ-13_1]
MKRAALAAATFAVLCLPASTGEAQAWTRDAGDGYVNLSYRYLGADSFYGNDGARVGSTPFRQHAIGLYGEVGVVDRWLMLTLGGDPMRRNELVDLGATTGLSDLSVGAWTGLLVEPFRLAFGVTVGLPTGDPSPDAGPGADTVAQLTARTLPTGDGETDVTLQVAAGHGFRIPDTSLELFVQAVLGYAIRTTGFTDQIVYRAEAGLRIREPFVERFLLIVRLTGTELLGSSTAIGGVAGVGDGISFTALGPELLFEIGEGFGLGFGADFAFRATNLPAAVALKGSISYRWDFVPPGSES